MNGVDLRVEEVADGTREDPLRALLPRLSTGLGARSRIRSAPALPATTGEPMAEPEMKSPRPIARSATSARQIATVPAVVVYEPWLCEFSPQPAGMLDRFEAMAAAGDDKEIIEEVMLSFLEEAGDLGEADLALVGGWRSTGRRSRMRRRRPAR